MMRLLSLFFILSLNACDNHSGQPPLPQLAFSNKPAEKSAEYSFGMHLGRNPKQLLDIAGPIVDYLNQHLTGMVLKLETARNHEAFGEKIYSRQFSFALVNPYHATESEHRGYRIFGKMGDDDDFRGVIIVRKDSYIQTLTDLKGQKISYPALAALAGTMLPQYYLHTHGLDINKDVENLYVDSHESAIMNVYMKTTAAGTTWRTPWKSFQKNHPTEAQELEIKWETFSLQNNAWIARDDVPAAVVQQVADLLFTLHTHDAGRQMLARIPVSQFEVAQHETYEPTRVFLKTFAATVRPITSQ